MSVDACGNNELDLLSYCDQRPMQLHIYMRPVLNCVSSSLRQAVIVIQVFKYIHLRASIFFIYIKALLVLYIISLNPDLISFSFVQRIRGAAIRYKSNLGRTQT